MTDITKAQKAQKKYRSKPDVQEKLRAYNRNYNRTRRKTNKLSGKRSPKIFMPKDYFPPVEVPPELKGEERAKFLNKINRMQRAKFFKDSVMDHYSGGTAVCVCCGETNRKFLTIDHINNDGKKHRAEIKIDGGYKYYRWLYRNNFPQGVQVMCFNCNFGKNVNQGVCPHKATMQTFDIRV